MKIKKSSSVKSTGVSSEARSLVERINSKFGAGSVYVASEATGMALRMFSTGVYRIDFALGGGIPEGRQTEIYGMESAGKTTLLLTAMAAFQRKYPDGLCVLVDFEKTYDLAYSIRLGIDPDRLLIILPDFGEQGVDMVKEALSQPVHIFIGIDSIAAIVASSTMEKSAGDAEVGVQARIINRMVAVCNSRSKRSFSDADFPTTTIVYLNQIRSKVGVMFGCVRGDTVVPFSDGTSHYMKDVVEKKLTGPVLAFNESTRKYEDREITGWHDNGEVDIASDYYHVRADVRGSVNGVCGAFLTADHKVLTDNGWIETKNLRVGNMVSVPSSRRVFTADSLALFAGILVGDSHISVPNRKACLQLADSANPEYVDWKKLLLSSFFPTWKSHLLHNKRTQKKYTVWTSGYLEDLAYYKSLMGDKRNPVPLLGDMTALSLAIWYMDDGSYSPDGNRHKTTLSVKRFRGDISVLEAITSMFCERGMECTYYLSSGSIAFTQVGARALHEWIAKYVPPCMHYKLPEDLRVNERRSNIATGTMVVRTFAPISKIERYSSKSQSPYLLALRKKYDITVQGSSNYLVGSSAAGFTVHNSPETTPGGLGKNFFASLRLKLFSSNSKANKIVAVKEVEGIKRNVLIGKVVSFEVIKTKTGSAPNEVGEYRYFVKNNGLYNAWSYDNLDALFEYGVFYKVIQYSAGYVYGDIQEKKKDNFLAELAKEKDVQEQLYDAILAVITRSNQGEEDLDEAEVEEV